MVAFRGQPVILLFRDGSGRLQSTNLLTVTGDVTSSNSCFPRPPDYGGPKISQQAGLSKQAVIGIVSSITSVVALLSVLVVIHFFLRHRRTRGAVRHKGIERGPSLTESRITPPPDPQPAQSSWNAITVINKPTPYPMEKYTSRPISPYFVQSTPHDYVPDRSQQMQSLNAATADLDQILNASVFISHGGERPWSSSLSPSTPHSRDAQHTEPPVRTKDQLGTTIPVSPFSFKSSLRDSIFPTDCVQAGSAEADSVTGDRRDCKASRRGSTTVQDVTNRGGQDGRDNSYLEL